jgi:hypothetical protein
MDTNNGLSNAHDLDLDLDLDNGLGNDHDIDPSLKKKFNPDKELDFDITTDTPEAPTPG